MWLPRFRQWWRIQSPDCWRPSCGMLWEAGLMFQVKGLITGTPWLSAYFSTVQAPAFCPMPYHLLHTVFEHYHPFGPKEKMILSKWPPFFSGSKDHFPQGDAWGREERSTHLPELCSVQRETVDFPIPKGATRLLVRCQRHYKRPSYLPVSLLQPLFWLQLQDRCVNMPHFRLGKGEMRLSSPKRFWGAGIISEGEDLGPEIMPCKVLLSKSGGWWPQSPITPHPEQRPMGSLTKGAHYLPSVTAKFRSVRQPIRGSHPPSKPGSGRYKQCMIQDKLSSRIKTCLRPQWQ